MPRWSYENLTPEMKARVDAATAKERKARKKPEEMTNERKIKIHEARKLDKDQIHTSTMPEEEDGNS